ncbi:carbohydrate kinase family protein [Streptomyces sp. SID5785]|uniref:carbohydrate kinase family protein n=1 Tax=Streptomyces sp. SID5785 TaxID=2690309 RepID=UPI001360BA2C|nr:carbohydrate kinase family protein [Streptomyces sp. SID5785]MZD07214.1 carbohydrate kinase family protein [Streptomyces sp. SID5785]
MRIAVTGSIAEDHLMTFPNRFADRLITERLDRISLSLLTDDLEIRYGGVAANIAFGLGSLGLDPLLVGAAGADFGGQEVWLKEHGVDTAGVRISDTLHTARFVCATDTEQNQLGFFYAGAMATAREIGLPELFARTGRPDLVVVSPDDPEAMVRHARECAQLGVPFVADPSQQLARLDREQARALLDNPCHLFTNEYEALLVQERTGWSEQQVLDRVGCWITTQGAGGSRIARAGHPTTRVAAVPPRRPVVDPTGAGDAYRAGFLTALAWGLDLGEGARLGSAVASVVLEHSGTQTYALDTDDLLDRLATAYGAGEIHRLIPRLGVPA